MLVSLLIVVVSLSVVRSQGGIQSGLCSGRDSACTELEEGETCYTIQHQADWTTTCNELLDQNLPTFESAALSGSQCYALVDGVYTGERCLRNVDFKCQNCNSSLPPEDTWPKLNYSFVGISEYNYLIDFFWSPPRGDDNVPGYMLVIVDKLESPSTDWNRCSNYDSEVCRSCVIYLNNATFNYRYRFDNLRFFPGHIHKPTFHVKLFPTNWCDGPSVTTVLPETCNHVCPGNCQRCGAPAISHISPPRSLLDYSVCRNSDSTFSATFWWESGADYYQPYLSSIFYFYLTTKSFWNGRITRTMKTRENLMPVTLHNLTLEEDRTYKISIQQFECVCALFKSFPFKISSSVADCNSRDSTEPIPTTTMNPYYSPYPTFHSTDVAVPTSTTMFTTIISHLATPTEQPVTSLATNHTVIAAVFGVVIVLVVVVSVATLFIFIRCWPSSSSSPKCTQINEFQVSPREEKTKLLVLYSWGTSELSQRHILQCLSPLTYDTDLVYSAKANIRGDIPQWVEKHINKSDKVLIICNEEFDAEWRSPGATHTEGAIVNALKAIINGHVNNGTMDIICCKFALVFLKENHKKLVPSGILHSFKQYVLHVEDSERQEELFRFILDTPLFQFCHDTEDQLKVV